MDPKRVAVIGARDLDPGEKRNLREAGVMVQSMEQIDRIGMVAALEKAIDRVSRDVDGIYLSFDMDALDPRHAPGVGTPVPGGLTYREAHLACEVIAENGQADRHGSRGSQSDSRRAESDRHPGRGIHPLGAGLTDLER